MATKVVIFFCTRPSFPEKQKKILKTDYSAKIIKDIARRHGYVKNAENTKLNSKRFNITIAPAAQGRPASVPDISTYAPLIYIAVLADEMNT